MSYERFYPGGYQAGASGGTPITPEALNHLEDGIMQVASAQESTQGKIGFVIAKLEAANWSWNAPYTQTVAAEGVTADWVPGVPTYMPIMNDDGSVNVSESEATLEEVAYVRFIASSAGQLTFICPEDRPTRGMWLRVPGML